jgi:hypothetical protein
VEVRFTVTLDDYVAYTLHVVRKSRVGRGPYLFMWLGLPLLCALGAVWALLHLENDKAEAIAFGLVCGAVACATIYPFIYRVTIEHNARTYARNMGARGVVGEITLVFSEESLLEITEVGRTEVQWEHMKGVEEVDDYTYIYVTGAGTSVIPRHGFASEAEYEAARDFAMRKLVDERQEHPDNR